MASDDGPTVAFICVAAFLLMIWLCVVLGMYERSRGWDGWDAERPRTVWDGVREETEWMSDWTG
jgi:hypothetical protein